METSSCQGDLSLKIKARSKGGDLLRSGTASDTARRSAAPASRSTITKPSATPSKWIVP